MVLTVSFIVVLVFLQYSVSIVLRLNVFKINVSLLPHLHIDVYLLDCNHKGFGVSEGRT